MLGELDTRVQTAICHIRADGGTVNRHFTLSTATAIIKQRKPSLLKDHGGHLNLTRHWCENLMKWIGLTKGKATKASRALPENFIQFNQEKQLYLSTIAQLMEDHQIPDSMIIKFDQTGVNIIPSSEWTMDDQGTKQVKVAGLGDKRKVTLALGCAMNGTILPPQVIYRGKTEKCHPNFHFSDSWDIHTHPTNGLTRPKWSGMQRKSSCPTSSTPENSFSYFQSSGDSQSLTCSKLINHPIHKPEDGPSMATVLANDVGAYYVSHCSPMFCTSLGIESAFDRLPHCVILMKAWNVIPEPI